MKKGALLFILSILFFQCGPKIVESTSSSESNIAEREINVEELVMGMASEEKERAYASGKNVIGAKCMSCHELYRPEEFSRAQWVKILDKERERAKLTSEEYIEIKTFLFIAVR